MQADLLQVPLGAAAVGPPLLPLGAAGGLQGLAGPRQGAGPRTGRAQRRGASTDN